MHCIDDAPRHGKRATLARTVPVMDPDSID
jgi:hypothetical protein